MQDLLTKTYFQNTVQDYLIAGAIIIGGMLFLRLFKRIILHRLYTWAEKTETNLDDLAVKGIERFGLPLLNFLVIYWGLHYLALSAKAQRIVEVATAAVITFFIIRLIATTIQVALHSYVRKQEGGEEKVKQLKGVMLIFNMVIWLLGALMLFDNLGYDVTTIVAGLGIGGIAIALAAQNILGDLFNYFVIFFDRPFEIGDYIVVDDKRGTVEYIGVKTTRLKSLTGEQLILSNSDLTKSRLHNFKRLERRRILFNLSIVYQTTFDQLREIPELLKKIIEDQPSVTFDRAHFAGYGASSLNFEVVYFVENSEYNFYMDTQQNINLRIFEEFQSRGIQFAYPTQTVFLAKETNAVT
ncbi:MAG: mechanosensitive ion channel [Cyclobacteriaceae bacterium]|nr:mechanosensitive ion channel [Cyclobacteriaceae bacterium]